MSALPGARVSNTVNTPPCLSSTLSTVKALFSGSLPTKWWQRWSPAEPGSHLHNLATVAEIWLFFLNISNQSPNSLPYWSGSGHIPISKLITLTRIGTGPLARTSIHPSIYLPIHPSLELGIEGSRILSKDTWGEECSIYQRKRFWEGKNYKAHFDSTNYLPELLSFSRKPSSGHAGWKPFMLSRFYVTWAK